MNHHPRSLDIRTQCEGERGLKRPWIHLSFALITLGFALGCGSDSSDDEAADKSAVDTAATVGGAATASTAPPPPTTGNADAGETGEVAAPSGGTAADEGADEGAESVDADEGETLDPATLYGRLGGNAGIAVAVDAVVAAEVMDPEIAAFFDTDPAAVPNIDQIKACLVLQLGNATGGPQLYPGEVSGGFRCRTMSAAHEGLGISGAVFDKFVMIAATTLGGLGVAEDDLAIIGPALMGFRLDVVEE